MKTTGVVVLVLGVLAGLPAFTQYVWPVQPGLIHYGGGQVFLSGSGVQSEAGQFPVMKAQDKLRTEKGLAEVLLNPGFFLRIGENSSIRMVSGEIMNARIELLSGSVILEIVESPKRGAVTIDYRDAAVFFAKRGIYRLDSNPAGLRVSDGEALVLAGGRRTKVKKGSMLPFDGTWTARKFNPGQTEALDQWSGQRAEYLAIAHVAAARSLQRQSPNFFPSGGPSSGWAWYPDYRMFSFVPYRKKCSSPYGYRYYNLQTLMAVSSPPRGVPVSGGAKDIGTSLPTTAAIGNSARTKADSPKSPKVCDSMSGVNCPIGPQAPTPPWTE